MQDEDRTQEAPDPSYVCWACGEEIVVPIDPTQGSEQDYVEDCPVCCRPNRLRVELDGAGVAYVRAEPES